MPINIIVEDGTQVANANSYVDVATARAYATNRGVTLSAVDDNVAVQLINAKDYLESKADMYVGLPVSTTQSLQWPRQNVMQFDGSYLATNIIPQALKDAQCQLVIEQFNGVVLMPTTDPNADGGFVISEKIDVLETRYSERIGTSREPVMRAVDALLSKLLYTSGPFALRSIRL